MWIAHYEPESAAFEQEEGDWFPVSQQEIVREVGEAFAGHPSRDDLIALSGRSFVLPSGVSTIAMRSKPGCRAASACSVTRRTRCFPHSVKELLSPSKTPPPLPAPLRFTSAMCLQPCCTTNACGITALPAFNWDPNSPSTICERRTPLSRRRYWRLDERVSPAFAHDKRGGEDDSWIYAYDARKIGSELPAKRLGPWDFRRTAKVRYGGIKLWMPANPAKGTRRVTREEVALHNTQNDCWIIISGKVYDITEWAPHHPGGAGIARMYAGKEATAEFR